MDEYDGHTLATNRLRVPRIKRVDDTANSRTAKKDAEKITIEEFLRDLKPPDASNPVVIEAYKQMDRRHKRLQSALSSMESALEDISYHKPKSAEERDIRDELRGVFIWPFLLAFAFAIRLTKTTIEVFDWTSTRPGRTATLASATPPVQAHQDG